MSSVEEIINYLYMNPNLSSSELGSIVTAFQGLNPRLDDFTALELILFTTPKRTKTVTAKTMPTTSQGLKSLPTRNRYGKNGLFRKIPINPNTYELIHNTVGAGQFSYSSDFTKLKYLGGANFSGDNAIVIDHNSNKFNSLTGLTIAFWIYLPATSSSDGSQVIFSKGNIKMTVDHANTLTASLSVSGSVKTITYTYTPSTWTHVTFKWSSSGGFVLKINAVTVGTMSASGTIDDTAYAFVIGNDCEGGYTSSGFESSGFEL
mgnify:CR=1 FL=1